jgi:hypothetical protein
MTKISAIYKKFLSDFYHKSVIYNKNYIMLKKKVCIENKL